MFTLEDNINDIPLEGLGLKQRFASIDLAPNAQLETGVSALDRNRALVRMDKLYMDQDLVRWVEALGPTSGTIVTIDMPKSLSIPNRWCQEEIKMHAHRLHRPLEKISADLKNVEKNSIPILSHTV